MSSHTIIDHKLIFLNQPTYWILILLAVLFLISLYYAYIHYHRTGKQILLMSLRVLLLLCLAFLSFKPAIEERVSETLPQKFVFIIDNSLSMNKKVPSEKQTPWQCALHAINNYKLQQPLHISYTTLDTSLNLSELQKITPQLPQTNILGTLHELQNDTSSIPIAGALLISDGADTTMDEHHQFFSDSDLASVSFPVSTVFCGLMDKNNDIAIKNVYHDDFAFVQNTVKFDVEIQTDGFNNKQVPIYLEYNKEILAQTTIELLDGKTSKATLKFKPKKLGNHIYKIRIPVQPGESNPFNNFWDFAISIVRDKYRVLQVAGKPSWDVRFLRQYLKENPNIDLISFFILRTIDDPQLAPNEEMSLIPFPTNKLFNDELHTFDLIVLQNFDYRPYHMNYTLPLISNYVKNGGAMVMIGGDQSFAQGGYSNTVIEQELLPVKTGLSKWQPQETCTIMQNPHFKNHSIFQNIDASVWKAMPALTGINEMLTAKTSAQSLLYCKNKKNKHNLLTAIQIGKGRIISLATDNIWQIRFLEQHYNDPTYQNLYYTLWSNMIRWLTKDPQQSPIQITMEQDAQKQFHAHIRSFHHSQNNTIEVAIFDADSNKQLYSTQHKVDQEGLWSYQIPDLPRGSYFIHASSKGNTTFTAKQGFVIRDMNSFKERNYPANKLLLEQLSKSTGGEFFTSLHEDDELPLNQMSHHKLKKSSIQEIWNHWLWLVGIFSLFSLELLLRRSWGLL